MPSKSQEARKTLDEFIPLVNKRLEELIDMEIDRTREDFTQFAVDYMVEYKNLLLGKAKRLRAAFVYYSYIMHGGEDLEAIMDVCAGVELLHMYILVFDDFQDRALTRRGYSTLHETYRKLHEDNGYKYDSPHFGLTIASDVGIGMMHYAMEVFNQSDINPELKKRIITQANRQMIMTGHGQNYDFLNMVRHTVEEDDIMNMLYWKSGIYTYDNPIKIGAIAAGVEEQDLDKLSIYGRSGGVSFQMQDDILGTFGKSGVTGKSDDGDIKEGKQTLLTWYAYKYTSDEGREIMDKALGNQDAAEAEIEKVRQIMLKTGSLEYSKNVSLKLVNEAKQSLLDQADSSNWNQAGLDFLLGIADVMIERDF